MTLTETQQNWFDDVTANGMTVAQRALDWAQASPWWQRCEDLGHLATCLEDDVAEGNLRGAKSKSHANAMIQVLQKAAALEESSSPGAGEDPIDAALRRVVEPIWGTTDPEQAFQRCHWPQGNTSLPGAEPKPIPQTGEWVCIKWENRGIEAPDFTGRLLATLRNGHDKVVFAFAADSSTSCLRDNRDWGRNTSGFLR